MKRVMLALLFGGIVAATALRALLPVPGTASEVPVSATPTSVDLYGSSVGFALQPGDIITVYTSAGTPCGRGVVNTAGFYGLVHVYGDDPTTPEIDGGRPGDRLELEVNGRKVGSIGPQETVWTKDGDRQRVDISK
ncbi:MAG: hypothetical protein V2A77_08070 [Pseudomonadota bacterium]